MGVNKELELLMEFDEWISERFKQIYDIDESKFIMMEFLNQRLLNKVVNNISDQ